MAETDPPYGGRIKLLSDGSARWSIAERVYAPDRTDAEGAIDYAIRFVSPAHEALPVRSKDGKCLVLLRDDAWVKSEGVVLIASGYGSADPPPGKRQIGRDYFITADCLQPGQANNAVSAPPDRFDLVIYYDDYDLQRANVSHDFDSTQLDLCYRDWDEQGVIKWTRAFKAARRTADVSAEIVFPAERAVVIRGLNRLGTYALMYRLPAAEPPTPELP